jgi:hypothetical protein
MYDDVQADLESRQDSYMRREELLQLEISQLQVSRQCELNYRSFVCMDAIHVGALPMTSPMLALRQSF